MGALRFIIVFIGIVVKGCMESPAIKTVLILLISIAAIIFIPYLVGLLMVIILPGILPSPAWPAGLLCIVLAALILMIVVGGYKLIYECVKSRMR